RDNFTCPVTVPSPTWGGLGWGLWAPFQHIDRNQMQIQRSLRKLAYRGAIAALAFSIAAASVLLPQRVYAAPSSQEYTYAECSRADEAAVQSEMAALAHSVLVEGSSG